ncbi:MAG: HAD-IA family hydrolase [Balneolaceae bacterium]
MPQIKPKFIYFDLDDTLLNHKKAEHAGLRDIHQHFEEFSNVTEENLLTTYHHINKGLWEEYGRGEIDRHILHRRRFEETFRDIGINGKIHEEAGKVYMDYYRNHWEWISGAKEAYHAIAGQYEVGLITNGFAETQRLKIAQFEFELTASQIVISEDIGVMKPHPKIFDYATDLTGVSRDEILYVGDSFTSDVIGSSKAGWKVAWFTKNPTDKGMNMADLVFDDYAMLLDYLGI